MQSPPVCVEVRWNHQKAASNGAQSTHRHTDTHKQRHTDTQIQIHTDTPTYRHRYTATHTHTLLLQEESDMALVVSGNPIAPSHPRWTVSKETYTPLTGAHASFSRDKLLDRIALRIYE